MSNVIRDHQALLRRYLQESLRSNEGADVSLERRLVGVRTAEALRPLSEPPDALYVAPLDPYDPSWCSPDWEVRWPSEDWEGLAPESPATVEETTALDSALEGVAETSRSALPARAKKVVSAEPPVSPIVLTFPEPPGHAVAASTSAAHGPPAALAAFGELAAA